MEALTRDFGTVTYQENDIIHFIEPIYGFNQYRSFLLLCDKDIGAQFAWLQSLDEPELCFILTNPDIVDSGYKAAIPESSCLVTGNSQCECWCMTVIPESFSDATINLKSPILINQDNHQAAQVILDADYPIRCPLKKGTRKEAESC
ncbi:MAG: flagellar assembly protein FliW [Oscillospiraceae bacterium]|jgi:flagellar assembly factor FliW|nr:flagellar assembly protein FliW [Oscillospiraceae bacterium]